MKILTILASPRRNGNTSVLLNSLVKGLGKNNDVESIVLHGMDIHPCCGCEACQDITPGMCAIFDDMQNLYKKIDESDMLVLATPVYWWNMSAQLKVFIDRFYALKVGDNDLRLKGKKVMLVMTYGGELPNSGPEIVEKSISEICEYTGMELIKVISVCSKYPVSNNSEALNYAYEAGCSIK